MMILNRTLSRGLALLTVLASHFTAHGSPGAGALRVLQFGAPPDAGAVTNLHALLAGHGIELDTARTAEDLHPARLAGYDAVMLAGGHGTLTPEQAGALRDFVERGGGLAAVASGSAADLAGIERAEGGERVVRGVTERAHPVTEGLAAVEGTAVHRVRLNASEGVVLVRGPSGEPLAWTRELGRGRVFGTVLALEPGTDALLERALVWVSENAHTRLRPRADLEPPSFVEAPAPLPNYVPNARWGTQGEPIRTMQEPLPPERSLGHISVFPEFEVTLFAAEPDIVKPIAIGWDERGRLWIAETVDYPNELKPPGEGRDRLKICEDTDGDGVADRFIVFADRLSIPTGFTFARDGVIVIHSGRTEFLRDVDGDDVADERQVLFEGWGTGDTHATASNLRHGFDNWIWGVVGYSGFRGTVGGRELRFGQGIFRFKPDGSALEFVRSSNNNTWGLGFSEEGIVFGSTANGNASMYLAVPNRYYEGVRGWSAGRLETIADSQRFYPLTATVRQVDFHGRYTAGAGSALYTARSFPAEYWNRVQFVTEPTGHLVGKFHLRPRGADFVAHNGRNFLASTDEWCSPVAAEVGPDGALWVSDWYNYIIQHNPTPQGFQTGPGNAYETPLRDKTHGRIYRVVHRSGAPSRQPALDLRRPRELVEALRADNLLWRLHAQRMLVHRGEHDIVPALHDLVRDARTDEIGLNVGAIHALWTLHGLGALDEPESAAVAFTALRHPSAGVRRTAAAVLPRDETALSRLLASGVLMDPEPQVRLASLLALAEMPPSAGAAGALGRAIRDPAVSEDRWLCDAATAAAARNDAAFLQEVLSLDLRRDGAGALTVSAAGRPAASDGAPEWSPGALGLIRRVARHYAEGVPSKTVFEILQAMRDPDASAAVFEGLVSGWPEGRAPEIGPDERLLLARLMRAAPEDSRDRLILLSQRWGLPELFEKEKAEITAMLRARLENAELDDEARVLAARRWIALEPTGQTVRAILRQIVLLTSPSLATGLIQGVAEARAEGVAESLLDHWEHFSPVVRRTAVSVLMRRPQWTQVLLDAIEGGALARTEVAVEQWSQLRQGPNRALARRAARLASAVGPVSADRQPIVDRLLPLAERRGDPERGREVYALNCAVCHVLAGTGGAVGPDLTGIESRDRADILLEILDPNRSVEANYRMWTVNTKDGEVIGGRLETETRTTVEILDTVGQKHVVPREQIASIEPSALSIMPTGFEALPEQDLVDLLEYLASPK